MAALDACLLALDVCLLTLDKISLLHPGKASANVSNLEWLLKQAAGLVMAAATACLLQGRTEPIGIPKLYPWPWARIHLRISDTDERSANIRECRERRFNPEKIDTYLSLLGLRVYDGGLHTSLDVLILHQRVHYAICKALSGHFGLDLDGCGKKIRWKKVCR